MALSADDYLRGLQALMPQGAAWTRAPAAKLTALLQAIADEFARLDERNEELLNEADPRTAVELLSDWERVTGLPDPCITAPQTDEERRAAVAAKLRQVGAQSVQYFIDVAAAAGIAITIEELYPAECGVAECGRDGTGEAEWRFVWLVHAAIAPDDYFEMGDPVGDPLVSWKDELLECLIDHIKPAHTIAMFAYEA